MSVSNKTGLQDFQPLQKLGQGSYSSVYKVRRVIDQRIYALKKVRLAHLAQKERDNALNEVRLLASVDSPYIIRYRQAFIDGQHQLLCIVMDWADCGDLQKILSQRGEGLPQNQIWRAAGHILLGLSLLHGVGILHRDLKTANVFFGERVYKLADMNVSKVRGQGELAFTQTGTPYYASPEIWRDKPYGVKSDIWSFGCILYQMCTAKPPFEAGDFQSLYNKISQAQYQPIPKTYSKDLADLIRSCLNKKSQARPSAQQLLSKSGILIRKHKQLSIPLWKKGQINLLQVLKFREGQSICPNMPLARYSQSKLRKYSQEAVQFSQEGTLSARKVSRKCSRIVSNGKYFIKLNKKTQNTVSQQKTSDFLSQRAIKQAFPKIHSMRNLQTTRKTKISLSQLNKSNSWVMPPLLKLKSNKIATQRRQTTEASTSNRQLQVIHQMKTRLEGCRKKMKKVVSSEGRKMSQKGQESKQLGSDKKLKKYSSNIYLAGSQAMKVIQECPQRKKNILKKKSKKCKTKPSN